jgi:hypothetical protein
VRRCPYCDERLAWLYRESDSSRWIGFCSRCEWMARGRRAPDQDPSDRAEISVVAEVGGAGDAPVPNPWAGIYRLASPRASWEPVDRPCGGCGATATVRGLRENAMHRYSFGLCLSCGDVVVSRILKKAPALVRLDMGNVGTAPTSMGVRWLVRGLGI